MIELPGKEGVLETPITMDGTNIEIVRHYDGSNISTVLFDFDGTLSLERDGWIDVMIKGNSTALKDAIPDIPLDEAVELVITDIQETIGIPTYMQMERLTKMITDRGGTAADPQKYKDDYNDKLVAMVDELHRKIASEEISHHQARPKNILTLLQYLKLHNYNLKFQIASGTDTQKIKDSVKILCLDYYFKDENIIGAGSTNDPRQCAKELIIDRLIEQGLKPGELSCFGDGFPELYHTYRAGGIGIGVLTPDTSRYKDRFTIEEKRNRLINAGAHIIIPDYTHACRLVEVICMNSRDI